MVAVTGEYARRLVDELLLQRDAILSAARPGEDVQGQLKQIDRRIAAVSGYARVAAPILAELRDAGFHVNEIRELRKSGVGGAGATEILVKWLPLIEFRPVKEDLIATLASPWARPQSVAALAEELFRIDPAVDPGVDTIRTRISDALERCVQERLVSEHLLTRLVEFSRDQRQGTARFFILQLFGKLPKSQEIVVPVLIEALDHEETCVYAAHALADLHVTWEIGRAHV